MSEKNREGKNNARERLRLERERERAAEQRMRVVKVVGIAVLALGLAAGVGVLAANQNGDDAGNGAEAKPITVGEATAPTLTVYEDFRCPACAQFENGFRDTIHELTDAGQLKVEYHLVTIIDGNFGGSGSATAANAAACARDADAFTEYHDVLFANQPPESDDAFADTDRLIDLAGKVEGLDTPTFRNCVTQGEHDAWVTRSNSDFLDSGHNATPTVLLNGENVYGDPNNPLTPESLREQVEELATA
ncbi:DsbA family protein [Streptomyces sp. 4N509B]|uniref:DsbA family protein n=1 Tax=Streptomyces sp. 4N509B TaxID=3457413 RepID=UPI003FD3E9BC